MAPTPFSDEERAELHQKFIALLDGYDPKCETCRKKSGSQKDPSDARGRPLRTWFGPCT